MQIVTTHNNADFDALASMVAATILYPGAVPVLPKNINPNVKAFLSIHKDVLNMHSPKEIDFGKVKSLIIVDINSWERLKHIDELRQRNDLETIVWDHHSDDGDINTAQKYHDEMGANITLMIRRLRNERKIITPIQATLFLTGLYEDTGNLTFPSTKPEDAFAASYLLDNKADLNVLNRFLRPAYGKKQKDILFEMIKSSRRIKVNGYKICVNKLDIKGHVEGLAIVVRMCREILNVDAAFGIFTDRERGKSIVIGRSNTEGINIGSIMQSMGGGGHSGAGSAMVKSANPDAAKKMIVELVRGNQQASVQISDLMSFPVFSITSNTGMKEVALILREKGYSGILVIDDGKLVGIISRRDFRKVRKDSQLKAPVKAFMSINITSVKPGESPMQVARLMVKHDIGRLPVIDGSRVIGIITRSDVMNYFYDTLPE